MRLLSIFDSPTYINNNTTQYRQHEQIVRPDNRISNLPVPGNRGRGRIPHLRGHEEHF